MQNSHYAYGPGIASGTVLLYLMLKLSSAFHLPLWSISASKLEEEPAVNWELRPSCIPPKKTSYSSTVPKETCGNMTVLTSFPEILSNSSLSILTSAPSIPDISKNPEADSSGNKPNHPISNATIPHNILKSSLEEKKSIPHLQARSRRKIKGRGKQRKKN